MGNTKFDSRPSFLSPRFSLRSAAFEDIERQLDVLGHAPLDDVWSPAYLSELRVGIQRSFADDDARFEGRLDAISESEANTYLGGFKNLDAVTVAHDTKLTAAEIGALVDQVDARFFAEFERTGLPSLYRHLLRGDFFVGRSERVLRRVDPRFQMRFAGLHIDGQLGPASSRGLRTRRELTLWTPLQDCAGEDISRLLLVHRGEDVWSAFGQKDMVVAKAIPFWPIQLRPEHFRDEAVAAELVPKVYEQFARLFSTQRCYSPPVPLGSAILFDRNIWHGSYISPEMSKERYSLDFRATGEYSVEEDNLGFEGQLYRSSRWPTMPHRLGGWRRRAQRVANALDRFASTWRINP